MYFVFVFVSDFFFGKTEAKMFKRDAEKVIPFRLAPSP